MTLLRRVLLANAGFSALSALVCTVGSRALADIIGLRPSELFQLGVSLAIFAAFMIFLATRQDLSSPRLTVAVLGVGIADIFWVVGTVALLGGPNPLTDAGRLVAIVIAVVVGSLGVLELYALWAVRAAGRLVNPA